MPSEPRAAQSYRRKITFDDRKRAVLAMFKRLGERRIRITPGQRRAILNGTAHRRRDA